MTLQADVVVPVYRDVEVTRSCLEALLRHSGDALRTAILVHDLGPEPKMLPMLRQLRAQDSRVRLLENERNLGFVGACNRGLALRKGHAVLLNSDTRVTPGWLDELLGVLLEHDRIAAVAPLSNNATLCSVPDFGHGVPVEALEGADLALDGLPRWTQVPTGVGFCLLLRDELLGMVGGLDPAYGRGYNEENDWCQRVQAMGFIIARANRALVYHLGQVSFGEERTELDLHGARRLLKRYPHYLAQNRSFEEGPAARVAAIGVRASLGRLKVCLDLTHVVAPRIHGTATYGAELAVALRQTGAVDLTVQVAHPALKAHLEERGVPARQGGDALRGFDLVHKPTQVYSMRELAPLMRTDGHLIFTWQDLIAYRSTVAVGEWNRVEEFRSVTWAALQAAQGVLTISEHARTDLLQTFGLSPDRVFVSVLGCEVTAPDSGTVARLRSRYGLPRPYFVCAGSDYPHKNLTYLLDGYAVAREQLGEQAPDLVLIGPASRTREGLFGSGRPPPPGVQLLGEVPAQDVHPLLAGARGLVFPSAYEGFGLPPLEAMHLGVPVIASSLSAVPEVVGDAALRLVSFRIEELATHLVALHRDERIRERVIRAGTARAAQFTWKRAAEQTVAAYHAIARRPSATSILARDALRRMITVGLPSS